MRNYNNLDRYLDKLVTDIYPQPPDNLQQQYGDDVICDWIAPLEIASVLDVGCGQGQFANTFKKYHMRWYGVTLGTDYDVCVEKNLDVFQADFSFLDMIHDGEVDLVFARHSLEHSPFPLLTLMEWNRVSSKFLCVILPNPNGLLGTSHVGAYRGRNHYSVMNADHFRWLAMRAGWFITKFEENDFEMRFLLIKAKEIIE